MLRSLLAFRPAVSTAVMSFYYGVIGPKAGIFNTWDKAKACTNGVSGARCKKFKTLKEAQDYLADHNHEFYSTGQLSDNKILPENGVASQSRIASKILLKSDFDFSKPVAVKKKFETKSTSKFRSYDELSKRLEKLNQTRRGNPNPPPSAKSSPLTEVKDCNSKRSRSPSVLASNETTENIKRRRLIDTVSISDSDEEIPETKKVVPAKPSRVIEVISSSGSDSEPSSNIWEDDDIFEEVPEFLLTPASSLCSANSNHHDHPSSSSIPLMKGPSGKPVSFKFNSYGVVVVYTDGACSNNGRIRAQAGLGVWFNHNHPLNLSEPVVGPATNNNAEIQAATRAMQQALKAGITDLDINTDSQFLIQCITRWIHKWKTNNWQLSTGGPVKNKEKLVELDQAIKSMTSVSWTYVRGHDGNEGNEAADALARQGALLYKPDPSHKNRQNKKKKTRK
nr:PREDICTED: uncharacterized protein LOC109035938 [Bemisia tabaci]